MQHQRLRYVVKQINRIMTLLLLIYILPVVIVLVFYIFRHIRQQKKYQTLYKNTLNAGIHEPVSLHPVFDPRRCVGSGACVAACPERAIGIIQGQAKLVDPTRCIGHGACENACPHSAISLVFGTEKRGVDIPQVDRNFQTNVAGIYIAGELGGMGLIHNASEQAKQAIEHIASHAKPSLDYNVVIVGAGPAGIAASLAAKAKGLRYLTLEQEVAFGGSIRHYPRHKIVLLNDLKLPLVGTLKFGKTTKEHLVETLEVVVARQHLNIHYGETVESIMRHADGHRITTNKSSYRAQCVLLALGRRGSPLKLGVPGEDRTKVTYRLLDAEQYQGQHVLVVGGGDSAVEAALQLAQQPKAVVTLSYRGEAFSRVKPENRRKLELAKDGKQLRILLGSTVKQIDENTVLIEDTQGAEVIPNDAVIVCAGGVLPTALLKQAGIHVDTKFGTV